MVQPIPATVTPKAITGALASAATAAPIVSKSPTVNLEASGPYLTKLLTIISELETLPIGVIGNISPILPTVVIIPA
jgi:hypothetical protein